MRISIITSAALEKENACRNRVKAFVSVAVERGHRVVLYSTDELPFILINDDKFEHIKVSSIDTKDTSFVKRAWKEWMLSRRLIKSLNANNNPSDAIILTIPSMFLLFASLPISRDKLLLDIRDVTWEYLSDRKLMTKVAKYFFRTLAKLMLPRAKLISVTNTSEANYLTKRHSIVADKVLLVSNGISQEQYNTLKLVTPKTIDADKMVVTYVGNIGLAQNLQTLISAAVRLPHIEFRIVGHGIEFPKIQQLAKELENVTLLGSVSWEDIPSIYSESDVLYAQLSKDYEMAMPSKLYEYLATGKYILYGGGEQAQLVLSQFEHNTVVESDNIEEIAHALQQLSENRKFELLSLSNRQRIASLYIRENNTRLFFDRINRN